MIKKLQATSWKFLKRIFHFRNKCCLKAAITLKEKSFNMLKFRFKQQLQPNSVVTNIKEGRKILEVQSNS